MGKSYRDLLIWQRSFNLTKRVYELTASLPGDEQFGLISQMRRCSVSIPSNIAEGQQRNSDKEFVQFLGIAKGSLAELETQLLLTKDIYAKDVDEELATIVEIQRMINTLVKNLRAQS